MRSDLVTLVRRTSSGEDPETEVIADIESISQSEFFEAAQTGLKPQCRVSVWSDEYSGQPIVIIGGKRYTVYRTYLRADQKIELYLTDKAGVR